MGFLESVQTANIIEYTIFGGNLNKEISIQKDLKIIDIIRRIHHEKEYRNFKQ